MSPAVMRALIAKGFTSEDIADITECLAVEELERIAHQRERNRINQRNHRARKRVTGDIGDIGDMTVEINREKLAAANGTKIAQESLLLTESESKKDKTPAKWNFAEFWQAYPRKKDKHAAEAAFRKVERSGEVTLPALLQAIQRIDTKDLQYVPYPATWLNRGGYLDELPGMRRGMTDEQRAEYEAEMERRRKFFMERQHAQQAHH